MNLLYTFNDAQHRMMTEEVQAIERIGQPHSWQEYVSGLDGVEQYERHALALRTGLLLAELRTDATAPGASPSHEEQQISARRKSWEDTAKGTIHCARSASHTFCGKQRGCAVQALDGERWENAVGNDRICRACLNLQR